MRKYSKIFFLILFYSTSSFAQNFDHSIFQNILDKYVDESGMVNYESLKNDKKFDEYILAINVADLSNTTQNEKLAFYINAYNALVIKNVLNHYPIDSPLKVDGFFKKIKFTIANEVLTLDELEHKHILTINKTLPHFGLVCAAKSCPKLVNQVYTAKNVILKLKENGTNFFYDNSKNKLEKKEKTVYLSEIFKWFKKDFELQYGSLLETIKPLLNEKDKNFINGNEVKIKFMKYNWSLNKQ